LYAGKIWDVRFHHTSGRESSRTQGTAHGCFYIYFIDSLGGGKGEKDNQCPHARTGTKFVPVLVQTLIVLLALALRIEGQKVELCFRRKHHRKAERRGDERLNKYALSEVDIVGGNRTKLLWRCKNGARREACDTYSQESGPGVSPKDGGCCGDGTSQLRDTGIF